MFSAQMLLEEVLGKQLKFVYWSSHAFNGTQRIYERMNFHSVFPGTLYREPDIFTSNWDFMEFMITSVEPPVRDLKNGEPVYMSGVHD